MTASLAKPVPKSWIMGISPYVPGKAASDSGKPLIKLSANENPLGSSPAGRAAASAAAADLATYPDPGAAGLRAAIAARYRLDPARIIYGTGSDELLHLAAGAFAGVGDEVIYPRYGFSVYDIAARRVGAVPVIAPDRDYGTDVDTLLACVTERTRLVYLANPNNPTGTFTPRAEIARLHAALRADILLVIDQAYAEYLAPEDDDGGLALAESQSNVFVCRTFSKIFGLAAERVGWGYGAAEMIDAMHRIRAPFNLTTTGQAAAAAAIADDDWVEASRLHNLKWRAWLTDQMTALGNHGLRVVPSQANFILILFQGAVKAETVYRALMDAGYATRWLPGQELPDALRITIGTEDQMRDIARIVRAAVGEPG